MNGGSLANVLILSIGLGTAAAGPASPAFLERVSNDPRSAIYDSTKPAGHYYDAPTLADLGPAFQQVASEILRLPGVNCRGRTSDTEPSRRSQTQKRTARGGFLLNGHAVDSRPLGRTVHRCLSDGETFFCDTLQPAATRTPIAMQADRVLEN